MIEPVSYDELYEKFHELYIAVIGHIICNITITKKDGTAVNEETLQRVQECCLAAFDELNTARHQHALSKFKLVNLEPHISSLAVLAHTLSSVDDGELLPAIQKKYKDKLSEEEFNILGGLCNSVSDHLSGLLSLSCKFLVATHDINLGD